MGERMTNYNVYETEMLKALLSEKQEKRHDLDLEIRQIKEVLNTRLAESYRFVRFTAMKQGQLGCIKTLRNASCTPGGAPGGSATSPAGSDPLRSKHRLQRRLYGPKAGRGGGTTA